MTWEDDVLRKLRVQFQRNRQYPIYAEKQDAGGIKPDEITATSDIATVPFATTAELLDELEGDPPLGQFGRNDLVRINFTPNPRLHMMPVPATKRDIQVAVEARSASYERLGIGPDDVVQNTFSFTPVVAGMHIGETVEAIGATHLPMGPGNTDDQIHVMDAYDVTVLRAFPSFAMKLAENLDSVPEALDVVICGGEPFTAIDGYRERMKRAFDVRLAVDTYGLSEVTEVARECRYENGLHVMNDYVYAEVVDPETGDPVPNGNRGELILTHLEKEAMPVQRYRTRDLTILDEIDCECGYTGQHLPEGVMGRTDDMHKVKGMKLYPSQIALRLAGVDGVDAGNFQVVVSRPAGDTDHVKVRVGGDPEVAPSIDKLRRLITDTVHIGIDELEIVPGLDVEDAVVRTDSA